MQYWNLENCNNFDFNPYFHELASQYDATEFAAKSFCRATYADCHTTGSLCDATKNFSHGYDKTVVA